MVRYTEMEMYPVFDVSVDSEDYLTLCETLHVAPLIIWRIVLCVLHVVEQPGQVSIASEPTVYGMHLVIGITQGPMYKSWVQL